MKLRGFLWWWEMVLLAVQIIAFIGVVEPRKRENGGNLGGIGAKSATIAPWPMTW
jgi:hypothetical protein